MLALELPLRDPVAVFALVLLVLLAAPLLERLRLPSAAVLLLAGVGLGPHGLDVLARDDTIVLLGTVGLLYIMFLAGLEIDLGEFWRHRRRSLGFGVATFAIPQLVGTALGRIGFGFGWPAAILLGSVFASHTLLAYPVARRLGLARSPAVTAAVGATILTDTLALLILAVIAGMAGGEDGPGFLATMLAGLAGLVALVGWGLPRLGAWALRTLAAESTAEFVFVLAAVFVAALGAEIVGVEPIIGAFLAGLALNRLIPESSPLMNRIGFVGNALFIPFFLISTGMLVDLGAFASGGTAWAVAGAMVATILLTKGGAAALMRPLFGYSAAEVGIIFGLTVPQAAATLAAVLIGMEVGLFGQAVLNGAIAMVLVTGLVGPWMTERAGRRLALDEAAQPGPAAPRQRILVSLANPTTVERLLDVALLVRDARSTEPLYPLTVVPAGAEQALHVARGERLLSRALVYAAGADVPATPLVRVDHNVARGLARAVAETQISTVVMGWDGSASAQRLLFGSIPDRLLHESPAMLLIAKGDRPPGTIGRVVLAAPPLADHEPGFADALRVVKQLAHRSGAALVLLTPEPYRAATRRALDRTAPAVPVRDAALDAWKGLIPALETHLAADDALVLLSARQGSVSWRASLDRLPRLLAQRFPELPLLVVYPAQVPISALLPAALSIGQRAFLDGLGPDRIVLGLRPGPAEAVLASVLAGLADRRQRADLVRELVPAAPDALPEIAPGIVLYHTHTADVEQVALFVGISRDGIALPQTSGPVHVVLALALPAVLPTRHALELLALTARLVHPAGITDALRACTTPAEVRATLLGALHAPDGPRMTAIEDEPGD
ncbi:MAG: cation:proton antiporter [Rhodothermales bacterium]